MCGLETSEGPVCRDAIEVRPRKLRSACCPDRLPACFGRRLADGHDVRPQELGPRCLAKRVQGATCVRRQEHLSACFGMRLVDEHGTHPRQFGPRYLR